MVKRVALVVCLMMGVASSGPSAAPWLSQSGSGLAVTRDPSAVGYLNLSKRHPDAADGPTEFAVMYALRRARGEIAEPEVDRARGAYADATRRFQVFWDTSSNS